MEPSVQDWLIVIGALLIVGVLLDAYRRFRNERRNPIRLRTSRFGMGGGFPADATAAPTASTPSAEVLGGARVVDKREIVELPPLAVPPGRRERREPRMDGADDLAASQAQSAGAPAADPATPNERTIDTEPVWLEAGVGSAITDSAGAQDVVVLHVLARDSRGFGGNDLLRILHACDVRFGEMNIFHRHEQEKGQGPVQFSVANATEPGSFDMQQMASFSTPGLSFFMRMPGPHKPLEAFDCMLETANVIVTHLDGELRDASNSVFSAQTKEHCRQRIRDFAHRSRTRK